MNRIITLSCLLACALTYLFWQEVPTRSDIHTPQANIPKQLTMLSPDEPIDLSYTAGLRTLELGAKKVFLIGGVLEKQFTVSMCDQRILNKKGRFAGTNPLYFGLSKQQIEKDEFYTQSLVKKIANPIFDSPKSAFDLPGLVIVGNNSHEYIVQELEDIETMVDGFEGGERISDFGNYALVSNQLFTVLIQKHLSTCKGEGDFGHFTFDIYKHRSDLNALKYFIANITDSSIPLLNGTVAANKFEETKKATEIKYGIQSLFEQMQQCEQAKIIDHKWWFASRYHYSEDTVVDGLTPIKSAHCKKVLATFYHTPAGNVLKQRAAQLFKYSKPMAAIATNDSANLSAFHNNYPIPFEQKALSLYQDILIDKQDLDQTWLWHKSYKDRVLFKFEPSELNKTLYVFGDNIVVSGADIISQSNQCFEHLCAQEQSVKRIVVGPSINGVKVTIKGASQQTPLLQQNVAQLSDGPSIQHLACGQDCEQQKSQSVDGDKAARFNVYDRNKVLLTIKDIPHLLAPNGGRINASMGKNITLSIDKHTQLDVQQVLDEYMLENEIDARFATLTLVNSTGEILALAQTPSLPTDVNFQREGYTQSYKPASSPLTFKAGYHDGGSGYVSGSVLKILSALFIANELGVDHEYVEGLSFDDWNSIISKTAMDPKQGCFPVINGNCSRRSIRNYIGERGIDSIKMHHDNQKYGLKTAVRDSLNTYFAFMLDSIEQKPVFAHQAFGIRSYLPTSKWRDFVSHFGFYAPLALDAGLLTTNITNTIFYAPPSKLRYGVDYQADDQLWRAAVGEQTLVTALQVAQFTLAIANEKLTKLSLLQSVDNREAVTIQSDLPVKKEAFRLVQEAMAMAADGYKSVKSLPKDVQFFAKSGTGEIGGEDENGRTRNNVWMTSYIHTDDPVIVTCQITYVRGKSTLCAEVLERLYAKADQIPALKVAAPSNEGELSAN